MFPIDYLHLSRDEMYDRVRGEVWNRWQEAEPELRRVPCLEELRRRSGSDADRLLGALVRLASQDGPDAVLAAYAAAHQLDQVLREVAFGLRDLSREIDYLVMAEFFVRVRSFDWRRRTHAYATALRWDIRLSLLRELKPLSVGSERVPVILVDPAAPEAERLTERRFISRALAAEISCSQLARLRALARAERLLTPEQQQLLDDVMAAEQSVIHATNRTTRGVCSQEAAGLVGRERGLSGRTIRRQLAEAIAVLRAIAERELQEVA